ncbi:MAG: TIGR03088 family PEP-CTERM/XrtA system glycosyltransferase [Burkholderiales bacterium]|nr:TIGR03088 family PEP-CTERM/XrtA system glycosyltransferase [Burkholderiales bacterium]
MTCAPHRFPDSRPLIVHVLHRFAVGGLENGVANLINRMPRAKFRHAVVAMTEITDFRSRIERDDVQYIALGKPAGHALRLYPALVRLFRSLQPAIVHTRNLSALEAALPAALAGVPVRVHSEHGRDLADLDGSNLRYRWLRRAFSPFVHRYVALSCELERYLVDAVGIAPYRVAQIYNGVDTLRFRPADAGREAVADSPFNDPKYWVVGIVGRMHAVKNPLALVEAFLRALDTVPEARARMRLVMVGDGPLRAQAEARLEAAGARQYAWLPGERADIPELMRGMDCFVLPSLAEGVSNTLLEAMASGLPVIATRVGGNPELVVDQVTGTLVPCGDLDALVAAINGYYALPDVAREHGRAARARVERKFSLDYMAHRYETLYTSLLGGRLHSRPGLKTT